MKWFTGLFNWKKMAVILSTNKFEIVLKSTLTKTIVKIKPIDLFKLIWKHVCKQPHNNSYMFHTMSHNSESSVKPNRTNFDWKIRSRLNCSQFSTILSVHRRWMHFNTYFCRTAPETMSNVLLFRQILAPPRHYIWLSHF